MKRYGSSSSSLSERVGISVDIDGSHDGEIHCLKAGGVAADAHEAIIAGTAKLLSGVSEGGDEDSFTDILQDEDELEENETWTTVRQAIKISACILIIMTSFFLHVLKSYYGRGIYSRVASFRGNTIPWKHSVLSLSCSDQND